MLHNNRSDLFSDRDDGVQGCHGILEYGSDLFTTDLAPVILILDLCQVDDTGTMETFTVFIQITHTEGHVSENLVPLFFTV